MPRATVTVHSSVQEGNDVFLLNRLVTADNTNLVQADVDGTTMSVRVFDLSSGAGVSGDPTTAVFSDTAVAITGVFFDTLQTDGYWDGKDSTGYNFRYMLSWDADNSGGPYLRGGHKYAVEFEADLASGTDFGVMRWRHVITIEDGLAL
jgi:hypothetical protein